MSSICRIGARSGLWVAVAALVLQGCGGGGGDSAAGSVGADRQAALKLDSNNFRAASPQGLRSAERPLMSAQHAALEVARLARNGALQMDVLCYNGKAHYTLLDADGNGVPSAGDSVKIDYVRCNLLYFNDAEYNGTLTIKLSSVDNAANGSVAGTLDLGAGLVSLDGGQTTWLGSMNFRRTESALQDRLEVNASVADDLRRLVKVTTGSGTVEQVEAYQHPQVVRVLQRDTARASISGSVSLASDSLGGRLDISIEPALSAYFGTHADRGSVRIGGASNSRITLRANAAGSSETQAELDSNGDGVADSTTPLDWNTLFNGYVFFEQSVPAAGFINARDNQFLRLISDPGSNSYRGIDLSAALRLQFDRPLAADTVLFARLVEGTETTSSQYGALGDAIFESQLEVQRVIEVDVQIAGAVVIFQPREKLRYGRHYGLVLFNTGDFNSSQPVILRAATGTPTLDVRGASFTTNDMLLTVVSGAGNRSVLMPGLVRNISADVPNATSLPVRYQWAQLSGPSLVLGSPTAATTSVRLADGSAPGISVATLQLTVTDAIGRSSIRPVEMQVANLAGASQQLYFASGAGDWVGAGQTRAYSGQTGTFFTDTTRGFLTVQYFEDSRGANWNLMMSNASAGVPAIGTYAGAVSFGGDIRNVPQMDFYGSGRACKASGTYKVLDIALDGAGIVQRLAVDFEQFCVGGNNPPLLRGSVRINSSLPITP